MADKKKKASTEKERTKIVRSADHRSHYVIGAVPQWTKDDLRLHMYNEIIEGVGGPYYVASTQIILPRSAIPRVYEALKMALKSESTGNQSEVSSMPLDVALRVDLELFDKEKKATKKKVQKIRRK